MNVGYAPKKCPMTVAEEVTLDDEYLVQPSRFSSLQRIRHHVHTDRWTQHYETD